jgi:hypothetical protein
MRVESTRMRVKYTRMRVESTRMHIESTIVFIFFLSFIRHVSSYLKKLGCSHFLYDFLKNEPLFQKWEFRFRWKFEFLKFSLSFIKLITQHKTVSYVKLSNPAINKNIFLFFFKLWHDLVTLKLKIWYKIWFFQIKITQMRVFLRL